MLDLWLTALSSRSRRRRPSLRVGLPWGASFAAWILAARLSVDGRAFDGGWSAEATAFTFLGGLLVAALAAGAFAAATSVGEGARRDAADP